MSTLNPLAAAAVVGALSGTHAAIWGMYKDAVHEGFSVTRFVRSIVVGSCVAIGLFAALRALAVRATALATPNSHGLLLMFGLAYAGERALVETWKTFFRSEDQSKYTIPMQFSIRGAPVPAATRILAGCVYLLLVAILLYGTVRLDATRTGPASPVVAALVGAGAGLLIAFGGAWKDAPTEGFEPLKFLRSPALTIFAALLLARLTDNYAEIAVAAVGYERATAETYKTFFLPSRARGKFAGKPLLFPGMLNARRYFIPAFVAIWMAVIATAVRAFI